MGSNEAGGKRPAGMPANVAWSFGRRRYLKYSEFLEDFVSANVEQGRERPEDFPFVPGHAALVEVGGPDVTVRIESKHSLTFFRFMHLANNATYEHLRKSDHVFCEGIEEDGEDEDGTPIFYLSLGS